MQATFVFSNKNNKSEESYGKNSDYLNNNKVFVNNDKISDYDNIRIANYTKTPNNISNNNNNCSNLGTMSQQNQVAYIANVTCKARFLSFVNVL